MTRAVVERKLSTHEVAGSQLCEHGKAVVTRARFEGGALKQCADESDDWPLSQMDN